MDSVENKLDKLGLSLPDSPSPVANYVPVVNTAVGFVYTSGQIPKRSDGSLITGKLGENLTVDDGYEAAKLTTLSLLSSLKQEIGNLERIKRIVKLLCMVNCTPDFDQQPHVANGSSDLLVELFGEKGRHARSAVGVVSLPMNVCVEIELIIEV